MDPKKSLHIKSYFLQALRLRVKKYYRTMTLSVNPTADSQILSLPFQGQQKSDTLSAEELVESMYVCTAWRRWHSSLRSHRIQAFYHCSSYIQPAVKFQNNTYLQFMVVNSTILIRIKQVKCLMHLLLLLFSQFSSFSRTSFPTHEFSVSLSNCRRLTWCATRSYSFSSIWYAANHVGGQMTVVLHPSATVGICHRLSM